MPQARKNALQPHIEELYSKLGYSKAEEPAKFKELDKDIHAYFTAYEDQVNILGSRDTLSDQIVLCATNYLTEESRGQRFWPENHRGIPVWPTDDNFITNAICHIFRRKGKAADVGRCNARKRARQSQGSPQNKQHRKSGKRRRRDESDDDDVGSAERLEGLSETTVKPWNEPPKGPDPRFCSQYIQSLNPKTDVKRVTAFTTEWLKADNSPWPEVADVKLQTFMHNREFYVHYDHDEDPTVDLINMLSKGSEIENLENGLLYVEFQNRIRDRVEFLTHQLTKAPYFVLEYRRDGAPQMTKTFATKWARREEHWELGFADLFLARLAPVTPKPPNRRRKLNSQRKTKSPVSFPNLRKPPIATPEKKGLASLAGTALQMTTREPEEDMADESMLDWDLDEQGAMFVSDALAVTSPRTTNRSRSISPEKSIVEDSLGRPNEGTTDTSPSRSPFREKSLDALRREPAAQDRDDDESGSQLSTCPSDEPLSSVSSTDHISAGNQPRPRSSRECGLEISDDCSDEDSEQLTFVDDSGNIRFLKTEPAPTALLSIPVTANHQSPFQIESPPSGETAQFETMQLRHTQVTSMSQRLPPSLLNAYPPRFNLPPKPSSSAGLDSMHDRRRRPDTPVSPTLPNAIRSEIASPSQPVTETPTSPPSPSANSPRSPSRASDKFLSHYGTKGSEPEMTTCSMETITSDSQGSTISTKARIRAEKRAAVLAEAAEWEEIRSRESKSKSRTRSPPQTSTALQGGDMPPPATPASVSVRNELAKSTTRNTDLSTNILSGSIINSNEVAGPTKPTSEPNTTVSPPFDKPRAATLPVHVTNSNAKRLSDVQPSQPRSSRSSAAAALARDDTPSTSATKRTVSQARIPRLVPNLTKPLSSIVSKARTSAPGSASNPTSHRPPCAVPTVSKAETCADSLRLPTPGKNTAALIACSTTTSSPSVAKSVHTQEVAVNIDTPIVSVVPRPAPEDQALSSPSCSASGPSPSSPLPRGTDGQLSAVPAVVQQPRAVSSARSPVTPNPDCIASTRSVSPHDELAGCSNIDMGVAAAMSRTLAAQTDDFLKHGSQDESSIETAPEKNEEIATEASKSAAEERPPRRLGAYAHVPESDPFSAKPSEKEIAAIQAQQLPYGIAPIRQERSIVKSTFQSPGTKTLELLIESANGEMNLDTGFPFDVVMNNTVSGFFSFYAEVSEAPIESFQQLIFTPTWENCSGARATKVMGESLWKKLKKILQTEYKKAQKNDPGETEFQIMVQMG